MPIRVDRKSESHSQLRSLAALAATSLAAVTLLIGPDSTLGLDVPTAGGAVGGATQVTQNVSSTVQQTTQQVATTVQETAQPVVQQTQQVVTQVQQTAAPVASAPTAQAPAAAAPKAPAKAPAVKAAPRTSAPAKRTLSPVRQLAATKAVATLGDQVTRAARQGRAAVTTHAAKRRASGGGRPDADRTTASSCDAGQLLSALSPILTTLQQSSLASILCNATSFLAPRGTSDAAVAKPLAPALATVVASAVPAQLRVLGFLMKGKQPTIGIKRSFGAAGRDSAAARRRSAGAAGPVRGAGIGTVGAYSLAAANAAAGSAAAREVESATARGGLFGSSVTGTEAIFALLLADWALLVGIAMWKFARRRRYVPLFS